jgi:hypothetical protein
MNIREALIQQQPILALQRASADEIAGLDAVVRELLKKLKVLRKARKGKGMKLSDASWIAPLLQAVADGQKIQIYCEEDGRWSDATTNIIFNRGQECYRINFGVLKYRLYLRKHGNSYYVVAKHDQPEKTPGFVKWLCDWKEVEV